MRPVNSKSLFAFICGQMEKLDKREIDVNEATAQSNLAKQANNILNYELKRADTMMRLSDHNRNFKDNVELREVESKGFDDTTGFSRARQKLD